MARELKIDKFTGVTTAGSILVTGEGSATTNLQQGLGKAWCNYTTASTFVNNDSFNIGSLTDAGAGSCTLNFSNSMNNANFSSPALCNETNTIQAGTTSSSVSIISKNDSPSNADAARNHTTTHGDLA